MKELVFATNNAHKLRELREIAGDKFTILSLKDINCNESRIPKNLVQVWFDDGSRLTYFSDIQGIKKDDLVTVEGKKENVRYFENLIKFG